MGEGGGRYSVVIWTGMGRMNKARGILQRLVMGVQQ